MHMHFWQAGLAGVLLCPALALRSAPMPLFATRRLRVASSPGDDPPSPWAPDDARLLASLRARAREVSARESKLPVLVLDPMLPRQVLSP